MKKLLTLLATMAIAISLSMPAFAQEAQTAQDAPQSAPAKKHAKKKHSKKKKASKRSKKQIKKETDEGQAQ